MKRVKIEEKLQWRAYRTNAFSIGSTPTPCCHLFPKIGGSQPHPKRQLLLSQERVKLYGLQILPVHSQGTFEHKPMKNFVEKGAWAYPGTVQIFWIPPIISETGKATNFKFCTHIRRIDRNKSPLKISVKVFVGVHRDSRKFSGIHIYGASRGHLYDSSAFLLTQGA